MNAPIPGEPVWMELSTTDLEQARSFYGQAFGWEFHDQGEDFGHYQIIKQGDGEIGGAMVKQAEWGDQPDSFVIYLNSVDLDATTAAVRDGGGTVLVEPMPIADQGAMAFYLDPAGAAIGAWQGQSRISMDNQGMFQTGWYELLTKDFDGALSFYPAAFGAAIQPLEAEESLRYSTIGSGQVTVAGICDATTFLPEEVPSYWRLYINVPDCDQAVTTVTELGGQLLDGPLDSPYGRVATVADNQGATFQLITPPQR